MTSPRRPSEALASMHEQDRERGIDPFAFERPPKAPAARRVEYGVIDPPPWSPNYSGD